MSSDLEILTNPPDTRHLPYQPLHTPHLISTPSLTSVRSNPPLDYPSHIETPSIHSLSPYHLPISNSSLSLLEAFICFKMGPAPLNIQPASFSGPKQNRGSIYPWAQSNLGCQLLDTIQVGESFIGPSGTRYGKRKAEEVDIELTDHPPKKSKEAQIPLKPKLNLQKEKKLSKNISLKSMARAKGRNMKEEGRKLFGGGAEKQMVVEENQDMLSKSLPIQTAEVAGLIMPPPPP